MRDTDYRPEIARWHLKGGNLGLPVGRCIDHEVARVLNPFSVGSSEREDAGQSREIGTWYLIRVDEAGMLLMVVYRVGIE